MAPSQEADLIAVRPGEGVDLERLRVYLEQHVPEVRPPLRLRQFALGSSNLTYLLEHANGRLVLRRPPHGRIARGAHDMGREYRAMSALRPWYDRAPRPVRYEPDARILGAPFLLSEFCEGLVVWDAVPEPLEEVSLARGEDAGQLLGLAVVDALAALHSIPVTHNKDLEALGRPEGYLARQVRGWVTRWERVDTGRIPLMRHVVATLTATVPETKHGPRVLHNDFKLNNCQFAPDDPSRVAKVFDWEMATVGDPMTDVATLLNFWPDVKHRGGLLTYSPGLDGLGLPSRDSVLERYSLAVGRGIDDIDWYEALAAFKHAVILEQLFRRYARGETKDERMLERGAHVHDLAEWAAELLARQPLVGRIVHASPSPPTPRQE